MSDIQSDVEIKPEKKKRNKPSKYSEDEKKERAKEALKKHYNKPDIKVKRNDYYKARYHELDEEGKKLFSFNFMQKYYNMNDDEYKNYLNQCKPYKRKYNHKKTEEKKLLEEEQQIIINKARERNINNRTINAMKDPRYNDYIFCV